MLINHRFNHQNLPENQSCPNSNARESKNKIKGLHEGSGNRAQFPQSLPTPTCRRAHGGEGHAPLYRQSLQKKRKKWDLGGRVTEPTTAGYFSFQHTGNIFATGRQNSRHRRFALPGVGSEFLIGVWEGDGRGVIAKVENPWFGSLLFFGP